MHGAPRVPRDVHVHVFRFPEERLARRRTAIKDNIPIELLNESDSKSARGGSAAGATAVAGDSDDSIEWLVHHDTLLDSVQQQLLAGSVEKKPWRGLKNSSTN